MSEKQTLPPPCYSSRWPAAVKTYLAWQRYITKYHIMSGQQGQQYDIGRRRYSRLFSGTIEWTADVSCDTTMNILPGHRPRKVFENGGQTGGMTNGGGRLEGCAGASAGEGRPLPKRGSGGIALGKFWKFMCKIRHLIAELHFVFIPNKVQFWPKPLVTNGSLKLRNGKLAAALCCALRVYDRPTTVCVMDGVNGVDVAW